MSALVGRGLLEAPDLRRRKGRGAAEGRVWREPIRRHLLRLGAMLLIILLLICLAWVIPVVSQVL